ncbi:MAG TPA: hypothetical protein VKU60_02090 [Chloroflexota bacterium]|nr:hypothetical protein [Chloroflexota bacterium]
MTDEQFNDLANRVGVLEQQQQLTIDAVKKELAATLAGVPVSVLTGPGSAAGDVDAVEGGQPVVEQQEQADQAPAPAPEPAPAPPANDPATLILQAANVNPGGDQLRLMNAWIQAEGGESHNNPLNVTAPLNGSWSWAGQTGFWNALGDDFGVVNFDTMDSGCTACARVIGQDNMSAIRGALAGGDAGTFVLALRQDPWGTDPNTVAAILGV